VYEPITENADRYDELFAEYTLLHDHFGRGGSNVMRRLKQIRRQVAAESTS
jgi:L-ribulokinase